MKKLLLILLIAIGFCLIGCTDETEEQIKEIKANTEMSNIEKLTRIQAIKNNITIENLHINDDASIPDSGCKIIVLIGNYNSDNPKLIQHTSKHYALCLSYDLFEDKIYNVNEICVIIHGKNCTGKSTATKSNGKYEIVEGI